MAAERCPQVEALRAEAEAVLTLCAPGAFLRWSRGTGLLASDANRRDADLAALEAAFRARGWRIAPLGTLLELTPDPARLRALEQTCPEPCTSLTQSLVRFRGAELTEADAAVVLAALKCRAMNGDPAPAEKRLRQRAAVALRLGKGGGGLYLAATVLPAAR